MQYQHVLDSQNYVKKNHAKDLLQSPQGIADIQFGTAVTAFAALQVVGFSIALVALDYQLVAVKAVGVTIDRAIKQRGGFFVQLCDRLSIPDINIVQANFFADLLDPP